MPRGRRLPDDELEPCGTLAAYRRHLRRGDPVDRDCREAVTRDWQDRAAVGYRRPSRGNRKAVHLAGLRGAAVCGCGRRALSDVLDDVTCRNCLAVLARHQRDARARGRARAA